MGKLIVFIGVGELVYMRPDKLVKYSRFPRRIWSIFSFRVSGWGGEGEGFGVSVRRGDFTVVYSDLLASERKKWKLLFFLSVLVLLLCDESSV